MRKSPEQKLAEVIQEIGIEQTELLVKMHRATIKATNRLYNNVKDKQAGVRSPEQLRNAAGGGQ